jgi:hypothetical protein
MKQLVKNKGHFRLSFFHFLGRFVIHSSLQSNPCFVLFVRNCLSLYLRITHYFFPQNSFDRIACMMYCLHECRACDFKSHSAQRKQFGEFNYVKQKI